MIFETVLLLIFFDFSVDNISQSNFAEDTPSPQTYLDALSS